MIAISGPDAKKFLQGQVTCNLDDISEQRSLLGALCSYQGKTICNFRIIEANDTCYMVLHSSLTATVMSYLKKYIAFSKAEMSDVSAHFAHIGCWGNALENTIASQLDIPNMQGNDTCQSILGVAVRMTDVAPRHSFLCTVEQAETLWGLLSADSCAAHSQRWKLLDIRAGIPEISSVTTEQFIPQMLNLDLIEAVSFKKGCYTGQEIIARSHYLGKQKRRLFRFQAPQQATLAAGTNLFCEGKTQAAGTVVDIAANSDGNWEILAVLKAQEKVQNQEITVLSSLQNAEKLSLLSLPYAIPIG